MKRALILSILIVGSAHAQYRNDFASSSINQTAGLSGFATDAYGHSFPGVSSTGGGDSYVNIDCDSTGANVKATASKVLGYYFSNSGAAKAYVKLYDKATAATSADTPIRVMEIPAASGANLAATEIQTTNGISVRCVTGVATNNTTSPATNQVIVNLNYK